MENKLHWLFWPVLGIAVMVIGGQLDYTTTQINSFLTPAASEVYQSASETFTGTQNVWYSPGTNVAVTGNLGYNFAYTNGHIEYAGTDDIKVILTSSASIACASGSIDIEFGLAKNGTLETKSVQKTASKDADAYKEITCQKVFDLSTGDYLDFYVRQTSSGTPQAITIGNGVWITRKINTLE